ncbi:MAG: 2-C-methyl-D-erythritol 2,4-cyclodiphosphate synthase [Chloroflexota bacterium]|jgi:2-C-methyl-D-erythritol 2,4-cyclodiphosphate synthase|nr:2-C-methyl-D-erythritol 2,4-cyclodiphosphate synthase [Chloroflexota bacterium]
MRVGLGYDVHPLRPGRDLVLGGVHIDNPLGLDGHSDADVLTHAVIDSLLGAAALGDIGQHFPASDPEYAGASSQDLLAMVIRTVRQAGYRVINVDSTVIAEEPRLQPHIDAIRKQLAKTLDIDLGAVSVKATSPEGIGALGREEGIAAHAVALIEATG